MPSLPEKRFGIIGNPVTHSASPGMHGAAYAYLKLRYLYERFPLDPEEVKTFLDEMRKNDICGVNVTIPYKEFVLPLLDEIESVALEIGAVNTIVKRNGSLVGYNTDGEGFLLSLEQELQQVPVSSDEVAIIGAGGSARSIAYAFLKRGVRQLTLINRGEERGISLRNDLQKLFPSAAIKFVSLESEAKWMPFFYNAKFIVQTTSVGMMPSAGQAPIFHFEWAHAGQVCCDIIYRPKLTSFLKRCQEKGAVISGGSGMLAGQGILAFKLFTGYDVAYQVMREELDRE